MSESRDLFNISKEYKFIDEKEYDSFLYEDFAFRIFSSDLIYPEAMIDLNQLYFQLVKGGHNVTIVSQERKNSKSATLLFLSQNKFQGNNIKFLDDYSNIWELYDVVITANPHIINTKPSDKICFKINCKSNESLNELSNEDESFDSIYEVLQFYKINSR